MNEGELLHLTLWMASLLCAKRLHCVIDVIGIYDRIEAIVFGVSIGVALTLCGVMIALGVC